MPDPREIRGALETVEGRKAVVRPTGSGLPRKLDELLRQMATFGFSYIADIRPAGARTACTQLREHRFQRFREGRWFARDGIRRGEILDLRLLMCADCGAVQVRDISIDVLDTIQNRQKRPAALDRLKRRDHILDYYSGSRPRGREYKQV